MDELMYHMPGSHQPSNQPLDRVMIWTRSTSDLAFDRQMLMALPVPIIHVPCISIEFLAIDHDVIDVLIKSHNPAKTVIIFTSQNAVAASAEAMTSNEQLKTLMQSAARIVTHGRKTAAAAEKVFQRNIDCVDSATSAAIVEATRSPETKKIWFSGKDAAVDLSSALTSRGVDCTRIVVYRTKPRVTDENGNSLSPEQLRDFAQTLASRCRNARVAVCFASPSAIDGWMEMVNTHPELRLASLSSKFAVAAIGPTTAKAALQAGFQQVSTCPWSAVADLAALGCQLA